MAVTAWRILIMGSKADVKDVAVREGLVSLRQEEKDCHCNQVDVYQFALFVVRINYNTFVLLIWLASWLFGKEQVDKSEWYGHKVVQTNAVENRAKDGKYGGDYENSNCCLAHCWQGVAQGRHDNLHKLHQIINHKVDFYSVVDLFLFICQLVFGRHLKYNPDFVHTV